jgi:hypothetical protein
VAQPGRHRGRQRAADVGACMRSSAAMARDLVRWSAYRAMGHGGAQALLGERTCLYVCALVWEMRCVVLSACPLMLLG